MIKKGLAFLMTFLIILSTLGNSAHAETKLLNKDKYDYSGEEKVFLKSLKSDELNAYQNSLKGVADDPDFESFAVENIIDANTDIDHREVELIESKYKTTSVLKNEFKGIKNYEAFVFKEDVFKINNEIKPLGSSSEEDSDSTYSVYYLIKLNYDKISYPTSGMRPNTSQVKIISTNSGVRVSNAKIVQQVWGTVYNTDTGKKHASDSYSRNINILTPRTGTTYTRSFTSPRNYYYDEIANGQCGFGVILTLQRSVSSRSWEYSTGFLGINNAPGWSPGER
ncbi:hypothetical protein [Clostridiisalibacter paucivorans]|uniref:hypothetical protein n=1 Tax=Clostridiisalibacter paucivorans TaxID=408753 RepID=UPI00047E6D52|nr:hypothetical protein [Clostridiisalibacter paucivorans]